MDIQQLLSTNQNAIGIFSLNDLKEFAQAVRRDAMEDAMRQQQEAQQAAKDGEELLTIAQACDYLHVGRTTFYRYCKAGYFHPVLAGGRSRFRKSELTKYHGQR